MGWSSYSRIKYVIQIFSPSRTGRLNGLTGCPRGRLSAALGSKNRKADGLGVVMEVGVKGDERFLKWVTFKMVIVVTTGCGGVKEMRNSRSG